LVDKNLIMRKLADLEQYLDQIREFSKITQRTYASEWKTQRVVERTLQMMIEVCADIAVRPALFIAQRSPQRSGLPSMSLTRLSSGRSGRPSSIGLFFPSNTFPCISVTWYGYCMLNNHSTLAQTKKIGTTGVAFPVSARAPLLCGCNSQIERQSSPWRASRSETDWV